MLAKLLKISRRARNDFDFFSKTDLDMIGETLQSDVRYDPAGLSALECWYQGDTYGKICTCREIGLLTKVERAKQSWNLQIKLWAEDIANGLLSKEEVQNYCAELPTWILQATLNQAQKMLREKIGFVPKFANL